MDNGDGPSTGTFRLGSSASSSLRNAANAIITASAGKSSTVGRILYNVSLSNGSPAQTLITGGSATPEPGTSVMIGLGLVSFGLIKRKFSRRVVV